MIFLAPPPSQCDVLVIVADDVGRDDLGSVPTPNLDLLGSAFR